MPGRAKALGLVALVVTLPLVGGATRQGGGASSIPVSRDVLSFTATTVSGEEAHFRVLNGGMATFSLIDGPKLGLVPLIAGDRITLTLMDIVPIGSEPGNEAVRVTGKLTLDLGQPVQVPGAPRPLTLTWDATNPTSPLTSDPLLQPQSPCSRCCVFCNDTLICACSVTTSCGSCCCANCGGCDLPLLPHAAAPRAGR